MKRFKRKLAALAMATMVALTAVMPAYAADDAYVQVYGSQRLADSGLLEGNRITLLYIYAYFPTDALYWKLSDQNDNLLYEGFLDVTSTNTETFLYATSMPVPPGFITNFGPSVTHIKLTLECTGNPGCDADAFIETR